MAADRGQLPSGPRGLPLVGYLPFLGSNLHRIFMDLALSFGPIYKISIGTRLYVIISSPSLAKEVVRDHGMVFAIRKPNIAALALSHGGNDIAFLPYGPLWRKLRRLFVALLLPRSPAQLCTVGGFTVPQGCKVFLNVWAMHRDPQFWDDPSEFRPDRFLGTGKPSYSGDTMYYMPFGSGRRICAGMRLGERMLMHVLASLLHRFDWDVPEGAELDSREKFEVVLEKATPLVAITAVRSPSRILKSDAAAGCY